MIQIKEEISKILGNMKLPPQIHDIIKELYLEYQKSYNKFIEYMKVKYPDKGNEISRIEEDIFEDYKEDLQIIQTIEFEEYEQRRTIIIEAVNNVLKCLKENKDISMEKFDNDMLETVKETQNETFTKILVNSVASEMQSSSKYFLSKINCLNIKTDKNLELIKKQFTEEIKIAQENIAKKSPQINQIIGEHFRSLYIQLKNVVQTYKNEVIQRKTKNTIKEPQNDNNER